MVFNLKRMGGMRSVREILRPYEPIDLPWESVASSGTSSSGPSSRSSESPLYSWGPDGFGHPDTGYWRDRNGTQVLIKGMMDLYLKNCIKFLEKMSTSSTAVSVKSWPIYKSLMDEAMKRGIDERTDWDE